MIKFVPTLTRTQWNFDDVDFSKYDEVLLTPNERFKGIDLSTYNGDIVIDNGGFLINALGRPKELTIDHLMVCEKLEYDYRYIFVLPDIKRDYDFSLKRTKIFVETIKPKRIVIPYLSESYAKQVEDLVGIEPEFYAMSPYNKQKCHTPKSNIHIFGRVDPEQYKEYRSYDTFANV